MIIGRGGCVIKQMQTSTRCRIQIPPTAAPGSMYRIISVIGNAAGCQQVKQMIETIVAEQSSQSVMSGVGFTASNPYGQQTVAYGAQNYYGQQQTAAYGQQQTTAGQQDYSAEWAAYYAAQAAAAAQGGAAATTAPTPAAATTTATTTTAAGETPAYDAYYDVFWQYASYYGEEAARKHYGAWSPPEGTPNPNIANGAAASAPVAAEYAPTATTQVSIDTSEIKDSSVRKVSNLPAWMNKS
jgi:far upstream element-binding protein